MAFASVDTLMHLVVALSIVLLLAEGLCRLASRWHLGLVTAEIGTGIILGPTLLGRLAPNLQHWIFAHSASQTNAFLSISNLCLFGFLFAAGLELDVAQIRRGASTILLTGVFGTIFPFLGGVGIVLYNPDFWAFPVAFGPVIPALLAGTLFSISALPVILRILGELKLLRTKVGETIVGAAVFDDLVGWVMFAAIVSSISGSFDWSSGHVVFVAFGAGIIAANTPLHNHPLLLRARSLLMRICAPLYFASMGLRVDFAANSDFGLIALLFIFSSIAKMAGVTFGSRLSGVRWRESLAIASGMNARGAMSVVLAGTALSAGLLTERLFVAFVCVAVATSVLSAPAMRLLLGPAPLAAAYDGLHARIANGIGSKLNAASKWRIVGFPRCARDTREAVDGLYYRAITAAFSSDW